MSSGEIDAPEAETLAALPIALMAFSGEGRLILVNGAMLDLLGMRTTELPPGTAEQAVLRLLAVQGVLGEGDPEARLAELLEQAPERHPRRLLRDATGRGLELRLAPLPGGGRLLCLADVSELVEAGEAAEARMRAVSEVLSRLGTGVAQYDSERHLILSNPAYAEMVGLPPDAVREGMTVTEIVQRQYEAGEFDAEMAQHSSARLSAYPQAITARFERSKPDGRTLRVDNQPMPDGGWLAELTDISEKHDAEQEARRRIARHDALMHALPVGVAVYGPDLRCTLVNPAYNRILAHSPISVGDHLRDILMRRALAGYFGRGVDPEAEVNRRLPLVAAPYSFEQSASGVTTVNRSVPLPGGGHAMVVTDVTELQHAQAEIRDRIELFSTMIESTRHGIVMFDAQERVVASNRLAAELCGIPAESFQPGTTLEELRRLQFAAGGHGAGETAEAFLAERRRVGLYGPDRYHRRNSQGMTIEVVTDKLPGGGFVRSYTDVTGQVAAEAEATRRAATLQTVLDNMRHGVILYDAAGHMITANALGADMAGIPREDMVPGVHFDALRNLQIESGEYTQDGDPTSRTRLGNYTRRRPDGTVVEVRSDPTPEGGCIRSFTDITALTRAQEEAAAHAAMVQAMLDNMRHGIALFDAESRLLAANALCGDLMGLGASLRPGMLDSEILRAQAAAGEFGSADVAERLVSEALNAPWGAMRRRRPDGTELELVTSPVPGGGFVLTLTDITARVVAERELKRRAGVLTTTLNATHQAITLYDAQTRVVAANDVAARLAGFGDGMSMIGISHAEVIAGQRRVDGIAPDGDPEGAAFLRSLDRRQRHRYQWRRSDGSVLDMISDPASDGGYVVSASDVTELVLAREEAQRRAGILQVMLDNNHQGIALFDRDKRLVAANALAGELMGVADRLVPGTPQHEILEAQLARGVFSSPGEDAAGWVSHFRNLDRSVAHRTQRNLPDGRRLDIASDPTPDGGYVVSIADITALVRAEAEAEQRAGILKTMLENNTSGILLYSADRRLVAYNALASEFSEIDDLGIWVGRTLEENLEVQALSGNLGEGEAGRRNLERLSALDRSIPHRNRRQAKGGRTLIVSSDPTPDGGFVVSQTDVTAVVRAEAEAARRAEILGVMLGNIRHGIALFDAGGRLVASNAKLLEMLELPEALLPIGMSFEAMIGMLYERGEYGTDEEARGHADLIRAHPRSKPIQSIRTRPNGAIMEVVSDPTPDGGWVITYTDVTEDRRIRSELEGARAASESANRAKSRFLATMSHELRTPLNAVIGFSEVLNGRSSPEQIEEFSAAIQEAGRHLLSLIDDILDITRAESGSLPVVVETVTLGPVFESVVRMIGAAAVSGKLLLATDLPAALPRLHADERRLRQVLLNLLSNATKFTPAGGEIAMRARADTAGLTIEVADTGIGIAAADLQRVFEPFTQIDSALARRFPGSGLGLHLCRALTEAQGGTLVLESKPGIGTTARLHFPVDKIVEADRPGLAPAAP
nr:PAS-domain containing protein [uncultured Roseococcus sp.]